MRTVAVDTLKTRLEEYVEAAEAGETVLVTTRDKVVAQLGPAADQPRLADEPRDDELEAIASLVRRGLMTPARRPFGPLPPATPIVTLAELLEELDRDREDR